MSLSAGARLGPYEILAPLGAGGMGEVYRARDTRLDRTVAIKILPELLAEDPQFRERFDREARAISQLTHPHICTLYDVGHQEATHYLVMEYLDGETLADRLAKGALPLDRALRTAMEIASALDKAHRAGIVHRDLKPGNIMLTKGGAKLLDFGLAKAGAPPLAGSGLSMLPTTPANLTVPGTILGTFQYMAPEQLEGQEADTRTDIFAFGAVVYEMMTGKKAFQGKSQASLIHAILGVDPPPLSAIQPLSPQPLDRVIQKCLAKEPADRWQTAKDLGDELKWVSDHGAETRKAIPARNRFRTAIWLTAASLAAGVLGYAVARLTQLRPSPPAAIRFQFGAPPGTTFPINNVAPLPVLAPNGLRIALVVQSDAGANVLAVRALETLQPQVLAGTEGAIDPFWSPDSRFLAFFSEGKLKKIDVNGGPPQVLCEAPGAFGGSWNPEGTILFGGASGPLARVSSAGGTPTAATRLVTAKKEGAHRWPWFLPDGEHFLYVGGLPATVYVGSLRSEERVELTATDSKAIYADGHLVFNRRGTLLAQPFDLARRQILGEATPIADDVGVNTVNFRSGFSASATGVLAYRSGGGFDAQQFTWFDRSGRKISDVASPAAYSGFDLSHDGRYVVANRDGRTAWVLDLARGTATRAGSAARTVGDVVWAPGTPRFVYRAGGENQLLEQPAFGGAERVIGDYPGLLGVEDWSRDGRYVAIAVTHGVGRRGLVVPVAGGQPIVVAESNALLDEFHFAPDGRSIAYNSDESGRHEVYLAPLPPTGERWQVSTNGGVQGRWRADGRELYYLAPEGSMMVTTIAPGSPPQIGTPKPLFKSSIQPTYNIDHYGVDGNGQRFLLRLPVQAREQTAPLVTVVLNWTAALTK